MKVVKVLLLMGLMFVVATFISAMFLKPGETHTTHPGCRACSVTTSRHD
jgi:hypothetical protein